MSDILKLGMALHLSEGLLPLWTGDRLPFTSPRSAPFVTFDARADAEGARQWEPPVMSLHDSLGGVLRELFGYHMLPFPGERGVFNLPVEVLLRAGSEAVREMLAERLGLPLEALDGGRFVLFSSRRSDGEAVHEIQRGGVEKVIRLKNHWTADGRKAMCRLRVTRRVEQGNLRDAIVSAEDAGRYLRYFEDFGTHFVSRVAWGGMVYQLFQCRAEKWEEFRRLCRREAGGEVVRSPLVHGFLRFMRPDWMALRGALRYSGRDPAFAASVQAGEWCSEVSGGDCLLQPFLADDVSAARYMARFSSSVAVGMDFAPQCAFMGVFRAAACRRLTKGVLLHAYGHGLDYRPPINPLDADFASVFHEAELPAFSHVENGRRSSFRFSTSTSALAGNLSGEAQEFFCGRVYPLGATPVPELTVSDSAFEHFDFHAPIMKGALFVKNTSGNRRMTLLDGLRFVDGAAGLCMAEDSLPVEESCQARLAGFIEAGLLVTEAALRARVPRRAAVRAASSQWLLWADSVARSGTVFASIIDKVQALQHVVASPDGAFPAETVRAEEVAEVLESVDAGLAQVLFRKEASGDSFFPAVVSAALTNLWGGEVLPRTEVNGGAFATFLSDWRTLCFLIRARNILDDGLRARNARMAGLRSLDATELIRSLRTGRCMFAARSEARADCV
jgi:hypothetical protein